MSHAFSKPWIPTNSWILVLSTKKADYGHYDYEKNSRDKQSHPTILWRVHIVQGHGKDQENSDESYPPNHGESPDVAPEYKYGLPKGVHAINFRRSGPENQQFRMLFQNFTEQGGEGVGRSQELYVNARSPRLMLPVLPGCFGEVAVNRREQRARGSFGNNSSPTQVASLEYVTATRVRENLHGFAAIKSEIIPNSLI